LHHFAFLVWLLARNFCNPKTCFLLLKSRFLTPILPFLTLFLMVLKGFEYTIAAYIYAFYLAFSGKKHGIYQHFTLRLAPKRVAFSGKTHCI